MRRELYCYLCTLQKIAGFSIFDFPFVSRLVMSDAINPIASGDPSLLFRSFLLFKLGMFREYISSMFIANTRTVCNYFASSFVIHFISI